MSSGVSFVVVSRLDSVKFTWEIEEHDPHSATCFVQMIVSQLKQMYDGGVFKSNPLTMRLKWILEGACLIIEEGQ